MKYLATVRYTHYILTGLFLLCLISGAGGESQNGTYHSYRVGVLLPGSGDNAMDFYKTLNWTAGCLEKEGIDSNIELICADTSVESIDDAAKRMLEDPMIKVVIGPASSDELIKIAPDFIKAKKLLISPSATSGKISEMFNDSRYIWRTTGGDRVQTRIIIDQIVTQGAKSVALLYKNTTYGRTFADWAGFYAHESGINLTDVVSFENNDEIGGVLDVACAGNPGYLIVAAPGSIDAVICREMQVRNSSTRLFFTDSGRSDTFLEQAGSYAEGAEGISPTADKKTGFFVTYQNQFDDRPSNYAALTRDALILATSSLARMEALPSEDPAEALESVVSGDDIDLGWDNQNAARSICLIQKGYLPRITGASGTLDYQPDDGTDPLTTWYVHWRVERGKFLAEDYIQGNFEEVNNSKPRMSDLTAPAKSGNITFEEPRDEITFVYSGDLGDFGFADKAYLGVLKAKDESNLSIRMIHLNGSAPEPDPVLNNLTGKQARAVIMLGFFMNTYAERVAELYPDVPVIIIDADQKQISSVKSASFSMTGASYLAGILAANQTKTGNIGVIAGMKSDSIDSFVDGFVLGAKKQSPDIGVNITYLADNSTGFSIPDAGETAAEEMYRSGTDIIFAVAGESGLGAISAAKQIQGLKIIGVDSDQSSLGPGVVIASVVKNVDQVVYNEIQGTLEGSYQKGVEINGFENGSSSLVFNSRFENLSSVTRGHEKEAATLEKEYINSHS
jgi:basic membrane lipoprotein Med (substrate-binding protein (PBP1-ABC) superfamily)/ABC-type branched-subunit amino acid transport system substrate-binding protein